MMSFRAVALSLVLHALLVAYLVTRPPARVEPDLSPVTVEILDTPKNIPEKSIVLQADAPPELLSETDKGEAKYLSEKKQRVVKEMRARETGLTENRLPSLQALTKTSVNRQSSKTRGQSSKTTARDISTPDDGVALAKKLAAAGQSRTAPGESRVNEALSDKMTVGEFTALNTDQYLYYTFYARVANQLRHRWESRVQDAMGIIISKSIPIPRRDQWITELTIYLDRQGRFLRAQTNRESGVRLFDSAARDAFESGAPYMNPPKELVGDDGMIRLRYSFSVHWNPVNVVRRTID